MVIRVDVVEAALRARYGVEPEELRSQRRVVALAAGGRRFDDALAAELAAEPELTLLCGRYEGFDERVNEHLASDVVSIGPYVLSGGELAAMVVCDAVMRRLPGVLGHEESVVEESFSPALGGAPEYPHYTRPFEWRGHEVPEVLRLGRSRAHPRVAPGAEPAAGGGERSAGRRRVGVPPGRRLRYHPRLRVSPRGSPRESIPPTGLSRPRLLNVRRHRQPRARSTAPHSRLPGG